jgi:hypothetical protein
VWEYLIIALPEFEAPTHVRGASAAVQALDDVGGEGWEAVAMTVLDNGSVAVLLKRAATENSSRGSDHPAGSG